MLLICLDSSVLSDVLLLGCQMAFTEVLIIGNSEINGLITALLIAASWAPRFIRGTQAFVTLALSNGFLPVANVAVIAMFQAVVS